MVQDPLTDALIGRLKTFGGNHRLSAFPKMDGSHVSGTSIKHKSPSQELERRCHTASPMLEVGNVIMRFAGPTNDKLRRHSGCTVLNSMIYTFVLSLIHSFNQSFIHSSIGDVIYLSTNILNLPFHMCYLTLLRPR